MVAQENERNRIARDLHDGLGQLISAARLNLERPVQDDRLLQKKSIEILEEATRELRNISFNLMPRKLDEFGLQGALEEMSLVLGQSDPNADFSGPAAAISRAR